MLSEKTQAKTTEMRLAFPDETRLDILDRLKGGELRA